MRNLIRRWVIGRAIRRVLRDNPEAPTQASSPDVVTFGPTRISLNLLSRQVAEVAAARPHAGRQAIRIRRDGEHYGTPAEAYEIPDHAHVAKWEARHLFSPYGAKPQRTPFGVQCTEPPLAMICPDCDMRQPVLNHGRRACGYCGTITQLHGTLLFWWRPDQPTVPEWKP